MKTFIALCIVLTIAEYMAKPVDITRCSRYRPVLSQIDKQCAKGIHVTFQSNRCTYCNHLVKP
jgi:hypothetical protein